MSLAVFAAINSVFEKDTLGMLAAAGGALALGLFSAGVAVVEGRAKEMHLPREEQQPSGGSSPQ